MRISDWSSDVCSSDLNDFQLFANERHARQAAGPQLMREVTQSPIKFGALMSQIFSGIHVDQQFGDCRLCGLAGEQIGVETLVSPRSFDPDIARSQFISKCRQHGRLVERAADLSPPQSPFGPKTK